MTNKDSKITSKFKKDVKKVLKQVEKADVETKYVGRSSASSSIDSSGNLWDISDIPQGLTDSNRVGDQVRVTDVELRYSATVAASGVPVQLRVILLQWNDLYDATTGLPTYDDILTSTYNATINACNSAYNHDNRGTFRVLSDRTHSLSASNVTQAKITFRNVLRKIKFHSGSTYYGTGKILLFMTSNDITLSDRPVVSFVTHLNYTDQ